MRLLACTAAGLLLAATAGPALAQEDIVVEGPGHEISPGTVIHPAVGVTTGIDSNVFYQDTNPTVAPLIRLFGVFAIASQADKPQSEQKLVIESGPDRPQEAKPTLVWRLGGRLQLEAYPAGSTAVTDRTNLGGNVMGRIVVKPDRPVSFAVDERLTRDTRPRNFESRGNLNRDVNHLKVGLKFKPGGGLIHLGLRYENTIDVFEASAETFANRIQHLLGARAGWQILPVTRLTLDASFGLFGPLGNSDVNGVPFKNSSFPLRVQFSLATVLSEMTTLKARIGYGNGFYSALESFNNVIGGLEFGYRYSEMGRISVSYEYDFHDSINANFFRDHALVAKLQQQLGLMVLSAEASARLRGYRGISPVVGGPSRDDVILAAGLSANYLLRDWFAIVADFQAVSDQTNYMTSFGGVPDDPSYTRIEATAGVNAAF